MTRQELINEAYDEMERNADRDNGTHIDEIKDYVLDWFQMIDLSGCYE